MSDERRGFISLLEAPFRERAPGCRFEYGPASPFHGTVLTVSVDGRSGALRIGAFTLADNVIIYMDPFPGDGVPHWQMYAVDDQGRLGERFVSCRIEHIVGAFATWLKQDAPAPPLCFLPTPDDHLRRLAATLAPAPPRTLTGESAAVAASLDAGERQRFEADVTALAAARLARLFPRDDDGRVRKGERVLLAGYGSEVRGRKAWLHVLCTGKGGLQIALEPLIGINHAHRWDEARWMWDARVTPPSPEERWGVAQDPGRARDCLGLVDQGRLGEALALYGVSWTREVALVAAGVPLSMADAALTGRWAEVMRRELSELAPWKLPAVFAGRARAAMRLFTLPGQVHLRKASLMLEQTAAGPQLCIEYTGSNSRLPHIAFKRLTEHDLARLEMAAPELPEDGAAPLTVSKSRSVDLDALRARFAEHVRRPKRDGYSAALTAGKKLPPEIAAAELSAAMKHPDVDVRRVACELGSALRLEGCAEGAMELLHDDERWVRSAAADLLRHIRHLPALPVIARAMLADRQDLLMGVTTLRNWGEKVGEVALRAHLASPDANVRAAVCFAVMQYGGKPLIPELVRMAAEDEPLVASAALHALANRDERSAVAAEARAAARPDAAAIAAERKRWVTYKRI